MNVRQSLLPKTFPANARAASKNCEPIEGGTSGTLTVNWVNPKREPTADYQAVAVYTIDGLTAESDVSESLTVENLPMGTIFSFR